MLKKENAAKPRKKSEEKNFEKKTSVWLYVALGAAAGFCNGLFGGGGGMIIVPMLVYLMKKEPRRAHATAIFLILPMSIVSGLFYASFKAFEIKIGVPCLIGVVIGGAAGALLLSKISSKWIMIIFALVMAAAGVKMLFF